jgi:hypothetical protein
MGRKSSAKAQSRDASQPSSQGTPPPPGSRSSTPLSALIIVAVVAVVGVFAYMKSGGDAPGQPTASTTSAPSAQTASAATPEPRWAKFASHKQTNFPPIPSQEFAPPRPIDVVRSAYFFAAEHPEILSYVPCFCGCERGGHSGNEDCFVAARNDKGDVTTWEPHGLECTVCIDVATEARQMYTSGASVRDIRAAIEKKWAGFNGGHTPTPHPPARSE